MVTDWRNENSPMSRALVVPCPFVLLFSCVQKHYCLKRTCALFLNEHSFSFSQKHFLKELSSLHKMDNNPPGLICICAKQ